MLGLSSQWCAMRRYEEGPVPNGLQTMGVRDGGKEMQIHELLQVSTPST